MCAEQSTMQSLRRIDFWIAVCFTLNYIVGSGFLTLPNAFRESGYITGLVSLLVLGILAVFSVIFLLEAGERARILKKRNWSGTVNQNRDYHAIADESEHSSKVIEDNVPLKIENGKFEIESKETEDCSSHKFEIPELCEIFLGGIGKKFYLAFIVIYMYGVLWAYSTVFAESLSTYLPIVSAEDANFRIYLMLFAMIVVPMSLLEFSEQQVVQVMLAIFRVVMLTVMVYTVSAAYVSQIPEFGSYSHDFTEQSSEHLDKLPKLLSIAAYAFIFHHSTPSLAHQVQDKSSLVAMFTIALFFCYVAYSLVGATLSLYFGRAIMPASNIMWEQYVGVRDSDGSVPAYAKLVGCFVVLFPAVDVASAFPLNAYTLGNNMMSGYYGAAQMSKEEKNRWKLSAFRLLAAIPPFLLASLKLPLDDITSVSGLTAFGIMFIFPALLSYYSAGKLESEGIRSHTIYSSKFTGVFYQGLVLVSGILLLVIVSGFVMIKLSETWSGRQS